MRKAPVPGSTKLMIDNPSIFIVSIPAKVAGVAPAATGVVQANIPEITSAAHMRPPRTRSMPVVFIDAQRGVSI